MSSNQQAKEAAKAAMLKRSKAKAQGKDNMYQYYMVIGGFTFICLGAGIYTLLNPQQSFADMQIIDETSILVHNGQGAAYTQAPNDFFSNWTIADAKSLFQQGLSDSQNMDPCRSGERDDLEIPEEYDWRVQYPDCVRESVYEIDRSCPSSYVQMALSAVEDRICTQSGKKVHLSAQELIDCDKTSYGCDGGNVNRVLAWGKRKGFISHDCYPEPKQATEADLPFAYTSAKSEGKCPSNHLKQNECRKQNEVYKVVDMCLAKGENDGIKKELIANGPVISQISPYTDFLTYSEGTYHRTQDSFKYNGAHIVKILGWEQQPDGALAWIIENSWGSSWGENGYGRVVSRGDTALDYFAVGLASYPDHLKAYYEQQQARQAQSEVVSEQMFSFGQDDEQVIELDQINSMGADDQFEEVVPKHEEQEL